MLRQLPGVREDARLLRVLFVVSRMNEAMRQLFYGGAWLRRSEAICIGALGLQALRGYKMLARESVRLGQPRFPIHSKWHMLCHTFLALSKAATTWVENPVCDSCQLDEGFVGFIARYSRRVSPKLTIRRTLDLYLTRLWDHWQA